MTRGRKTGGRDFKPGVSGNPAGRPKTREDLKQVKLLSQDDVSRIMQKMLDMKIIDLDHMVNDPDTPAMELMIAKIMHKAMIEGDQARLDFLFNRVIGKVLDKKEIEVRPVTYRTQVRGDGALIQEVLEAESEEEDGS